MDGFDDMGRSEGSAVVAMEFVGKIDGLDVGMLTGKEVGNCVG